MIAGWAAGSSNGIVPHASRENINSICNNYINNATTYAYESAKTPPLSVFSKHNMKIRVSGRAHV